MFKTSHPYKIISRTSHKNLYNTKTTHRSKLKKICTAGFSDIYTKDYSGYFKDIKDYIFLNGEKYCPQDISSLNIFSFQQKTIKHTKYIR